MCGARREWDETMIPEPRVPPSFNLTLDDHTLLTAIQQLTFIQLKRKDTLLIERVVGYSGEFEVTGSSLNFAKKQTVPVHCRLSTLYRNVQCLVYPTTGNTVLCCTVHL